MSAAHPFDTLLEPASSSSRRVFLVLPAMGVAAAFYRTLAQRLAHEAGAVVAVADLRGQGRHADQARASADFSYADIVEHDIPALLHQLRLRYPSQRLYVIGHSLGGQLALLSLVHVAGKIDGLILVAAGTAHWRAWAGTRAAGAWLLLQMVRIATNLLPFYPGKRLGFGGNQPRALMRDWICNASSGRYALHRSRIDYEAALQSIEGALLAINFAGDAVAPLAATDALIDKLPLASVERATVQGVRGHSPWERHFSWAKQPDAVVGVIDAWSRRPQPL